MSWGNELTLRREDELETTDKRPPCAISAPSPAPAIHGDSLMSSEAYESTCHQPEQPDWRIRSVAAACRQDVDRASQGPGSMGLHEPGRVRRAGSFESAVNWTGRRLFDICPHERPTRISPTRLFCLSFRSPHAATHTHTPAPAPAFAPAPPPLPAFAPMQTALTFDGHATTFDDSLHDQWPAPIDEINLAQSVRAII